MEVNVISPEERAKVEGKSYLRSRLAGFKVTTESPVQHAHRTEFYCSRKLSAAGRTGASFLHFHGLNRPSDATRAAQSAWISSPISPGSDTVRQLRWEATANGQTPKQNRAGAKPWEALHGRHFQFQLRVRSRYGADNVRKLVVYTSGRIDHDAVNARDNRGVNGETPI
jgi:hypothetical protein